MLEKASKREMKELNAILGKAVAYDRQGMLAEAARSYRFLLSKRQEPVAHFNYAVVLKKMQAYQDAIRNYENAIALKPDYAEAYANLGNIYQEMREFEKALEQYNKAIHFGPMLALAYYNRGVVLQELTRHDEALEDYDKTLVLQPNYYLAYLNKSVILYELKRKAEAAHNYGQIIKADPDNIDATWNLGILRLSEGDFATGWKLSEARLRPQAAYHDDLFRKPYWYGQDDIEGKTLFIKWEQGFGDTIQFCRYAILAKNAGAKIILSVQNPLKRLVATLDQDITVIGEGEIPEQYDY
jgi:tetratricopeptide (TPR) repeat protein